MNEEKKKSKKFYITWTVSGLTLFIALCLMTASGKEITQIIAVILGTLLIIIGILTVTGVFSAWVTGYLDSNDKQ